MVRPTRGRSEGRTKADLVLVWFLVVLSTSPSTLSVKFFPLRVEDANNFLLRLYRKTSSARERTATSSPTSRLSSLLEPEESPLPTLPFVQAFSFARSTILLTITLVIFWSVDSSGRGEDSTLVLVPVRRVETSPLTTSLPLPRSRSIQYKPRPKPDIPTTRECSTLSRSSPRRRESRPCSREEYRG